MPAAPPIPSILDRVYLEVRAKLLEVAASLDRIDRADDSEPMRKDQRMNQIHEALDILRKGRLDRAERIQMIFSDPYAENWPRPQPQARS